jgi:hypothetical protein
MTYSNTRTVNQTQTFTITDARYLASRIATGLDYLRLYCGQLTEQEVHNFTMEAAILLKAGLLENVKYGYQKANKWVYALSYSVNYLGQIEATNDSPSALDPPPAVDLSGAVWASSLTRRSNSTLSQTDRDAIEELLPISRSIGSEPSSINGTWSNDDSYFRNGFGMTRSYFSGAN